MLGIVVRAKCILNRTGYVKILTDILNIEAIVSQNLAYMNSLFAVTIKIAAPIDINIIRFR